MTTGRLRWLACAAAALGVAAPLTAQAPRALPAVELRPGLVITHSVRVVARRYRLQAPQALDSAVIVIRGSDLLVDFAGATLEGQPPGDAPDRATGVGIRIDGGRNIVLRHARIRGFKVAVLARGTHNLSIEDVDASYNWKPRLYSLVEHESLIDWLSFHHNENREWLRYGAALYLEGVRGGRLAGNRALQGMNGLLLVGCDSLRIEGNDFSFNSGLGIGLYRSSDNHILRNRLDYAVRGYSHGFYHRGQDSAGLLLYEQSSRNLVAWNSATHGGDGLFLWAGQSTMDSGAGGANDNVFYGNDFSYAPANAMEATFSRNSFIANRATGSDYGLWGGYSFGSVVAGNCFSGNRTGIAIEHGQDNRILANLFSGDTTAVFLWANPIEPSDWGYPKHRDTRSRGYRIAANVFRGNRVALRVRNTSALSAASNRYRGVDSIAVLGDTAAVQLDSVRADLASERGGDPCAGVPALAEEYRRLAPALPAGQRRVPEAPAARRDRSAIVVDEWGPFDWRSPKLWPLDSTRAVALRLRTLGPAGQWRLVGQRGIGSVSRAAGRIGDTVVVSPLPASNGDWELELEYRGAATVTPLGVSAPAGSAYRFRYGRFEPAILWSARFFAWHDSTDLRSDTSAFDRLLARPPLLERKLSRLDLEWYRPQLTGLPLEHWAVEAVGQLSLEPGSYALRTISDDGIRVWVDDTLVIDRWSQHESALDQVPLAAGRHSIRVRFFQVDGWTELRVEVVRESRLSSAP